MRRPLTLAERFALTMLIRREQCWASILGAEMAQNVRWLYAAAHRKETDN